MLYDQKISIRTSGGSGFLRPSDAAAVKTKGSGPPLPTSQKSTLSTPFDDMRWPYAISPLQAYLCGVITVWALFILYHFIIFAIHAVRKKRIRRGHEKKSSPSRRRSKDEDKCSLNDQHHSLHTAQPLRPCARMAEIPPKSPVLYQPNKKSKVKVHRKLTKKIARRSASRQRRKSRREFARSKTRVKKASVTPTSPSCELFHHMNSHPFAGGVQEVSESRHSFVCSERKLADPQSSKEIPSSKEGNDIAEGLRKESEKENVDNVESTAYSGEETSITETRFLVLISSGSYEYTQKAQQKETLDLFNDLQIAHVIVDGMDPLEIKMRNHLFEISGVRGQYPQIFSSSNDDNYTYLGGYDWLQSMSFDDLRKIVA